MEFIEEKQKKMLNQDLEYFIGQRENLIGMKETFFKVPQMGSAYIIIQMEIGMKDSLLII